ncbi:hypothetical protein M0R45_003914 [Rubus argutus]|uniref:Uncharacterized protein n=1 Tax=Rubus argutus TaxID=59490 RepID=A0AAW1YHL0_RUBAR
MEKPSKLRIKILRFLSQAAAPAAIPKVLITQGKTKDDGVVIATSSSSRSSRGPERMPFLVQMKRFESGRGGVLLDFDLMEVDDDPDRVEGFETWGMLVLSIAAPAPVPAPHESSIVVPNTSTITCAEKCVISCALNIFSPGKYAACIGLCITACKIQPTSNIAAYACTRSCVTSISKSITTTTKPSVFGEYAPDFKVKGNWFEQSCVVYAGKSKSSNIVAQMHTKHTVTSVLFGKDNLWSQCGA